MVSNNRLSAIWRWLARGTRHARYVDSKDLNTFDRRYTAEGLAFVARGLPAIRTATLAALERGWWEVADIEAGRFGPKRGSILPRFLHGAFQQVFTPDGRVREDFDVGAVDCLCALGGIFGKIDGGHTLASEAEVIERFVENEARMSRQHGRFTFNMSEGVPIPNKDNHEGERRFRSRGGYGDDRLGRTWYPMSEIVLLASQFLGRVLQGIDPFDITPRAGTGASACGLPLNKRFEQPRMIDSIDRYWHYSDYWAVGKAHLCDVPQPWSGENYVPMAKVLLVPKDARGPRLISCEPRETMWIQQGLMRALYGHVERHRLTKGEVNFTDQTINQRHARAGSLDALWRFVHGGANHQGTPILDAFSSLCPSYGGEWATMDLKDASDLVSCELVEALFPQRWAKALMACRSQGTVLPDGRVVVMRKHAPMGSATCFPVMALCIWSIAKAVTSLAGYPLLRRTALVYGDDIIVPSQQFNAVRMALEFVGLKVNDSKSYANGPFRESCGKEYVLGIDVTPVRLRVAPTNDTEAKLKTIAFVNNCSQRYSSYETAGLRKLVREWYGPIPEMGSDVKPGTDVIYAGDQQLEVAVTGAFTVDCPSKEENCKCRRRWNPRLQRREFYVPTLVSRVVKYPTDHWSGVLRALVQPNARETLGTDPLPKRTRIKYRWVWLG